MTLCLFCAHFRKFCKYDPCLYQFLHQIKDHRYTRRLILRPISAARPRIDLYTKNPPPESYKHDSSKFGPLHQISTLPGVEICQKLKGHLGPKHEKFENPSYLSGPKFTLLIFYTTVLQIRQNFKGPLGSLSYNFEGPHQFLRAIALFGPLTLPLWRIYFKSFTHVVLIKAHWTPPCEMCTPSVVD